MPGVHPDRRPAAVVLAAAGSGLGAVGLLWFGGGAVVVLGRTGQGADPVEVRGMVAVALAGLAGAVVLAVGSVRTLRGRYTWTRVPLCLVLVIGAVGETVDLVGTASGSELAIGAVVLAAAALPVGLLATAPARRFAAACRAGTGAAVSRPASRTRRRG